MRLNKCEKALAGAILRSRSGATHAESAGGSAPSRSPFTKAKAKLQRCHPRSHRAHRPFCRADEAQRCSVHIADYEYCKPPGAPVHALIISTTKYGFFVELADLFVEGLVPIETLPGDRYRYHENGRKIIGERNRKAYAIGDRVHVRLDRADVVERKLQFAIAGGSGGWGKKKR
jgi:exoribonuclease R